MSSVSVSNIATLRELGMTLNALADAMSESEIDRAQIVVLTDKAFVELNKLDFTV